MKGPPGMWIIPIRMNTTNIPTTPLQLRERKKGREGKKREDGWIEEKGRRG